jgi:hypothetical protein
MGDRDIPLPPASFEFLVLSLKMQAEYQLGLFGAPGDSEESKADLSGARHFIDLLGVLQEKTKGNLGIEEQRLLDNSVTELRFRYLHAFEQSRHQPEPPPQPETEPNAQ